MTVNLTAKNQFHNSAWLMFLIALVACGCAALPSEVKKETQPEDKTASLKKSPFKKMPDAEWREVKASEGALRNFREGFEKSRTNPEEAIKSYTLALSKEPGFAEARYNLGLIFMKLGDAQGGKNEFLKAIDGGSKMPEIYNALGIAYAKTGQLKAAENALTYAASVNPRPATLTNLANVYLLEGKDSLSNGTYEKALSYMPDDPYANYNAGLGLLKAADFKGAASRFKKSLAIGDKTPEPGLAYAEAVTSLGDYAGAAATYEDVLKMHPKNSHAHINLGIIYELYLNELGKAEEHYKAYISLNGERSSEVKAWLDVLKAKSKQQ